MLFHWVIFFTSVISINSISQTADNVDSQPVVYSDDSISSQDALLLDTNSDAQPSSQNSPFSEIDSSQNSVAAETGLSQDAVTAGTDLSQAEFAAETDSSRILITDCTSAAPTVDVDDENNQILARNDNAQFCRAEPDVPPLTKPIPPSPREADPNLVPVPPRILPKLKRPPGSEPATPPEKPTIRTKPSDGGNPCPVRDGKHQGRKVHVTCGGPEAVISGMFSSESRFVVNCLLGSHTRISESTRFPETDVVAEYCCQNYDPSGPALFSSWCTKIKALFYIERISLASFKSRFQANTGSQRDGTRRRPKNPERL